MDEVKQLWVFVAPGGSKCPTFSAYLTQSVDDTFAAAFNNAVDYADAELKTHYVESGGLPCDIASYRIEPGPILDART